jgi:hypothetical protein
MLCTAILLAGSLQAATQEPAPAPPPTAAEARYQQLLASWAKATAVHFSATAKVILLKDDQEMDLGAIEMDMAFARPLSGQLNMQGEVGYEKERFPVHASIYGDGKRLVYLDHKEKSFVPAGGIDVIALGLQGFTPLQAWAGLEASKALSVKELEAEQLAKNWTGLEIHFKGSTVTFQFDPDGALKVARVAPSGKRALMQIMEYHFHSIELKAKVELAVYNRSVPEGYSPQKKAVAVTDQTTATDQVQEQPGIGIEPAIEEESWPGKEAGDSKYERDLLATGSIAPDVTFTDMQGKSFSLASLRGKTVLLNFWFYH